MAGVYINPLDFKTILIDYFLGTTELFVFAFVLIFAGVSGKFGMSNRIFLSLLGIGCTIFYAANIIGSAYMILITFLIGIVVYSGIKHMVT